MTKKQLIKRIKELTAYLARLHMKPTFLEYCKDHLGMDASPRDLAPDELGCAETVSTLRNDYDGSMPIFTYTPTMYHWLSNPANGYQLTSKPEPGAIIISPTGYGKPGTVGHVGIINEDLLIMSNTSIGKDKGKFVINYTEEAWRARYYGQLGIPVYLFVKKK